MSARFHNYQIIEYVAEGLGDEFLKEVAFVGGATTAMLCTDSAVFDDIRFTDDVDLVIELAGIAHWQRLTERLAAKGFRISGEDEVNCRFRFNDVIVDVMPCDAAVLGYTNRWFVEGLAQAVTFSLPSGRDIRVFQPPLFLATKLEAFQGRGNGDPYHKDVEDIVIMVDGRSELLGEVQQAQVLVRVFIAKGIASLLALNGIEHVIESSGSVRSNPGRGNIIYQRLKGLSQMA